MSEVKKGAIAPNSPPWLKGVLDGMEGAMNKERADLAKAPAKFKKGEAIEEIANDDHLGK
jgi:hypothetical protein